MKLRKIKRPNYNTMLNPSSSSNPSTNSCRTAGVDVSSGYYSDSSSDDGYDLNYCNKKDGNNSYYLNSYNDLMNDWFDDYYRDSDPERIVKTLKEMSEKVQEAQIQVPELEYVKWSIARAKRKREKLKKKYSQLIKEGFLILNPNGIVSSSSGSNNTSDQAAAVAENDVEKLKKLDFFPQPCKKRKRSPEGRRKREVFDEYSFLTAVPRRPISRNRPARPSDHHLMITNPNQETAAIDITHHHNLEVEGDHTATSSKPSTTDDHMIEAPEAATAEEDGGEGRRMEEYESYKLVFEKELTATDVSTHQHHLKIPRNKVREDLLLTEEEVSNLIDVKGYRVPARLKDFITGLEYEIYVRLQKVGKEQRCLCYTIAKPWNDICSNARLQEGTRIQLRASRPPCSGLTFFLNKKLA